MNPEELKKLSDNLTKEDREQLSAEFGVSIGHIYNVLSGQKENDKILLRAVEMIREHRKKLDEASAFVSSL